MSDRPLVSVVTPVYNTEEHLGACIESVRAQTYENWEYVVFDNRSSDRSSEIASAQAARDPRMRVVEADRHREQLPNYNRALAEVSPDASYVTIAQADDRLYPECVEKLVRVAEADEEVGIVGCYRIRDSEVIATGLPYSDPPAVYPGELPCRLRLLDSVNVIGSPTAVLYRSRLVRELEPFFDPARGLMADLEVAFRALHRYRFGFVHQVLGIVRSEEGSISHDEWTRFRPDALQSVLLLERYGERYLTGAEREQRRQGAWSEYEVDLAKRFLEGRGPDYWRYHRDNLDSVGLSLSWSAVAAGLGKLLLRTTAGLGREIRKVGGRIA